MNQIPQASVLVCITDQLSCERLIRAGSVIAEERGVPLQVISVLPKGLVSENRATVLQDLYDTAISLGAEMIFYFNNEPALTVSVHARKRGAVHIVSGAPGADSSLFIGTIKSLMPEIPISVVDAENRMYTFPAITTAIHSTK